MPLMVTLIMCYPAQLFYIVCIYSILSVIIYVPEKGSVGASGDLAPLSHLTLGMIGEGQMWSPETGWGLAADVR